jgi:hypothetical protein
VVIDELLVVLGLDSSKFNQGQREALDAFRKTKQGADEFAKDVERQSMKMADVFGIVGRAGATLGDDADASLRKIRSYISGEMAAGRMTGAAAGNWLSNIPGMNQDMINLLTMTTHEFNALADAAKKAGIATNESAEAGALLTKAFTTLILKVEDVARKLTPLVELLTKPLSSITGGDLSKAFGSGGDLFESGSPMDRLDSWLTPYYRKLGIGGGGGSSSGGGNTRGDRNNNPGNIEYGAFARAHGATGTDGRFAIFPDRASGESAMGELLAKNYQGLTLAQIQRKWVGNEDPNYLASMSKATGIGANEVPNLSDPAVRAKLMGGMSRGEGTYLGARAAAAGRGNSTSSTSSSSSEVNIGTVNVNAPNAKDADGIAKEIGPAMKRSSIAAPANYGLT